MKIILSTRDDSFGTEKYSVRLDPSCQQEIFVDDYWISCNYRRTIRHFPSRVDLLDFVVHHIQNECLYYLGAREYRFITWDSHAGDGNHFLN